MKCQICGREYEDKYIVRWLGYRICVYCMGHGKERTKRGPPKPPKPPKPEEEKPKPGVPPEYRKPPEIFKEKEEEKKEAWEIEEERREAGPPPAPPPKPEREKPEAPREEKGIAGKIIDAIKNAFGAVAEAIRGAVEKVREWFT